MKFNKTLTPEEARALGVPDSRLVISFPPSKPVEKLVRVAGPDDLIYRSGPAVSRTPSLKRKPGKEK